jgi:hypothetical protein
MVLMRNICENTKNVECFFMGFFEKIGLVEFTLVEVLLREYFFLCGLVGIGALNI